MPTILLTEDDAQVRQTVRRLLATAGYRIVEASDGRACLKLLRTQPVDLLITDVFMPELDGIEVIASARKEFADLPILAISGGGVVEKQETLEIALRLGATRILAKPLERQTLLSAVRELLGEH